MKSKADIIKELEEFQQLLYSWEQEYRPQTRSAINKKIPFIQKVLKLTGTSKKVTISPPPMIGGLIIRDVDPLTCLYDPPYGLSVTDIISDCIDEAIGIIESSDDFIKKLYPKEENKPRNSQTSKKIK